MKILNQRKDVSGHSYNPIGQIMQILQEFKLVPSRRLLELVQDKILITRQ